MRILITGGTGFVGQHLARALLRQGHEVTIMGRSPEAAAELVAAGARPVRADLRDAAAVADACRGAEAVCHAGALSAPWGPSADFYATNVGGTAAVIAGCRRWGVSRLVYLSSPSVVFDGRDQRDLTEAAPYPRRFASVYSRTKKLGEDLVRAADVPGVILRPKAVFGPGDTSLLPRIVAAARAGRLPQIGDGRNLVDLTYVENVAHACALTLASDAAVDRTYHITNDEHVPLWEVIRTVLRRLGIPDRLRRVPLALALAGARAMELRAALLGGEPLLTRYTARILARTQTYDIAAARRDLGYAPLVSVGEGVELTLRRMESEG
jgi:nucleoside-diphosphate-sugar epimerase